MKQLIQAGVFLAIIPTLSLCSGPEFIGLPDEDTTTHSHRVLDYSTLPADAFTDDQLKSGYFVFYIIGRVLLL